MTVNFFFDRLPLPQSIKTWKGVDHHTEVTDDPSQHEGKIRSFKHERGTWATLVYILYKPSETLLSWMNLIRTHHSIEDGKIFEEFHVSLTRTVPLKFHWIDSFVEGVKKISENSNQFAMELTDVKVYCNDNKTRTFLGICCENDEALNDLTEALNKLLNEYLLPRFYEEASHHVSFLWCLDNQEERLKVKLPSLSSSLRNFIAENPQESYVQVQELHCKVGNRLYTFNLR
ncbi:U6 snRNA phosphodiesterase isoform X2 [Belonocnema kinseyi]|uniref:U6 snRNA phosphodiesterase isoform X2 n=1 Tax=Belonocnema kinseyi TaxID=2817044 RepID=UPI00143D8DCF|nr:U6 snRNA phosphodiesterase isoform X2 [Belonocnema kinseyi]